MNMYCGVGLQLHTFLTSVLELSRKLTSLVLYSPDKRPTVTTAWAGWVGPRYGLDVIQMKCCHSRKSKVDHSGFKPIL